MCNKTWEGGRFYAVIISALMRGSFIREMFVDGRGTTKPVTTSHHPLVEAASSASHVPQSRIRACTETIQEEGLTFTGDEAHQPQVADGKMIGSAFDWGSRSDL